MIQEIREGFPEEVAFLGSEGGAGVCQVEKGTGDQKEDERRKGPF